MSVGRSALLLYLLAEIVHAIPTTSAPLGLGLGLHKVIAESMVAKDQQADHNWADVLTEIERTAPEAAKADPDTEAVKPEQKATEKQADHNWADVLTEIERTAPEAAKADPDTEAVKPEQKAKDQQADHNWANVLTEMEKQLTEMERTALATNAPTSAATATSFAEVVAGAATSLGSDDSSAYLQWLIPVLCVGLPVMIALVVAVTMQCTNDKDSLPPSFDVKRDSSHTHFLPVDDHARDHAEDTPEVTPEKATLPPSFE